MKAKIIDKMTEDDVVIGLQLWLRNNGWSVSNDAICLGMTRGIDITATKGSKTLLIEAKGAKGNKNASHTTRPKFDKGQVRVSLGSAIVKCLEMKQSHPDAQVAIAQPDDEQIKGWIGGIIHELRAMGIKHYWVKLNGEVVEN